MVGEVSSFRGTLDFLGKLGVYDVILPFLLVFTIMYAILEKTRIFGTEKVGNQEITRKNLNGMTAFVTAFFVVASTQLVGIINKVLSQTVLLLLLSICFLLLVGSFHTGKEEFALKDPWKTIFMVIMFVGIVLIFLNALGWLDYLWTAITQNFSSVAVSSVVMVIVIVVFMLYVTGGFSKKKGDEKKAE